MTTDSPIPHANPADVAEQNQEAFSSAPDEGVVDVDLTAVPIDANEADFAEQRIDAEGLVDDDVDEP